MYFPYKNYVKENAILPHSQYRLNIYEISKKKTIDYEINIIRASNKKHIHVKTGFP